jgi:hypothetical protein
MKRRENMINKELLNKNRVLTMSNNRKCNYLIVDVGANDTTIMGINTQGSTKDLLIIKTFKGKNTDELVNEVYWLCKEFGISIVLVDRLGFGLNFIDKFRCNIKEDIVQIREVNFLDDKTKELYQDAYFKIEQDLKFGNIRLLQTSELASASYNKPFLGYSNIMQSHKETDELINEFDNVKLEAINKNIKLNRINDEIGLSRVKCLLLYYSYPFNCINEETKDDDTVSKYEMTKRMSQHYVAYGVFNKYMFKCIENENINVIFYCSHNNRLLKFRNFIDEKDFKEIFNIYIDKVCVHKEYIEIIFQNGSAIQIVVANDSSRGRRYHFAIVDSEIDKETFDNVIRIKGTLFDMAKRDGLLKDKYNIEFIEM